MKIARDSSVLIAVPAMLIVAGSWWISTARFARDDVRAASFDLEDEATESSRDPASRLAEDGGSSTALCGGEGAEIGASHAITGSVEDAATAMWSGTVRARDGTPVEGAIVSFRMKGGAKLGDDTSLGDGEWITATAGPDGMVAFPLILGRRFEVEVRAPGFGLERYDVEGQVGQDLTLDLACTVGGRVVGKDGSPVAGAAVVLENENERLEGVTDADGRFRFEGVGARAARIHVAGANFVATERGIDTVPAGQTVAVGDVRVGTGSPLNGSVIDATTGTAVAGADIVVRDRLTAQVVSTGISDAAGRFQFTSIHPTRQYTVTASGVGFRFDAPPQLFGSSHQVTLPVVSTWTFALAVRDASGSPIGGVRLQLKRADGMSFPGAQSVVTFTNASGLAAFSGLSASLGYRVILDRAGYATMDLGPATAQWNSQQALVVAMVPARSVSGFVLDDEGFPVQGVMIRAQRVDGAPAPALFAASRPGGAFTFDSLYPGTISLVTFRSGYDNTRLVVDVPNAGGDASVVLTIPLLNGLVIR